MHNFSDSGSAADDAGAKLVVEHSHLALPGDGTELYNGAVDQLTELNTKLRGDAFATRFNSACGTSFLLAYISVGDAVVGFDVLSLKRDCGDSPGLRLNVEKYAARPQTSNLVAGMTDPLSVRVVFFICRNITNCG